VQTGQEGYFPSNYVQVEGEESKEQQIQYLEQALVVVCTQAYEGDDNCHVLTLAPGNVIVVTAQEVAEDSVWYYGTIQGAEEPLQSGWFLASYVQAQQQQ